MSLDTISTDLKKLMQSLPFFIQKYLQNYEKREELIEIVMDLGRRPEARFLTGPEYLSQKVISWQDLDSMIKRISKFNNENRAGIERTLHRISCIRNRQFLINGLTYRVGRDIFGTISIIRDLLESSESLLILGKPGIGKTTIIREVARVLADEMEKRVIIIDTSNEIGGDSDIPHSGIGRARRMQVAKTELQHQTMIEAVENHMPEVIIIDEISTEPEAVAARTITEKGVQLIGTTHGNCLENLIKNPLLVNLVGGIQHVTLSDDEAKRRGTQKSILERKSYPAFQIIIEINEPNSWTIHEDVKKSIDLLLQNSFAIVQTRNRYQTEKTNIQYKTIQTDFIFKNSLNSKLKDSLKYNFITWKTLDTSENYIMNQLNLRNLRIYAYSISDNLIKEVITKIGFSLILTNDIKKASLIIALKRHVRRNIKLNKLIREYRIPVYTINQTTIFQIYNLFTII